MNTRVLSFVPVLLLTASAAPAADAAADPVDLKPLALECYGVRGAAVLNSNTVVAVIGASCLGNRDRASAWRITSEEDPAYAYEKFVRPTKAKALPEDVEFALPPNFGAPGPAQNPLKRHLVVLTLPEALKPGVRDGTESQGDPGFAQTVELDPTGDYAYEKSCKASFLFAGAFAQASRVLAACGRRKEAADCLARARRAYGWGVANVPDGLRSLGQFAEYRMTTRAYAAAELLHTTGDRRYLADFRDTTPWAIYPDAPVREDKRGHYEAQLAAFAFVRDPENEKRDPEIWARVKAAVVREADSYIEGSDKMAYKFVRHPAAPIVWGIGAYGNFLPPVVNAWFLTGDRKYRDWTIRTCDNMLGANPLGLSWIVGLGERCNRAPLHSSRFRPEGVAVDGFQGEGPNVHGNGYNYKETVYPAHKPGFAVLYAFSDNTFSLPMTEGLVVHQALDMAVLGLLLPDAE